MTDHKLDQLFFNSLSVEAVKGIFSDLVARKTDLLDGETKIAKGSDGLGYIEFGDRIEKYANIICEKGASGKYCFAPFREVVVPKPPYEKDQLEEAKAKGKIRTLSISTIQDTLFQEILSRAISPCAERIFQNNIDQSSFAYRKEKSSKMAVKLIQNYISQGFVHIIDGDIEKFFDQIDHKFLMAKCSAFFGDNPVVLKFIYRFMHTGRIPDGVYQEYRRTGRGIEKRTIGIPQGGVLSGLLANVFLYDFDLYVLNVLRPKHEFQYIRYADDFVLMFKERDGIEEIFKMLETFLKNEKLVLHPLSGKSKLIDVGNNKKETLDFLGFEISPKYLRVKHSNVKKFLHRIEMIIKPFEADDETIYVSAVCKYITPKIIGLEELLSVNGYCETCGHLLKKRNWMGYFMMIDDVRQLREIDTKIRRIIYDDYHAKTKHHLKKKVLLQASPSLLSLEKTYYLYKKHERLVSAGKVSYCNCHRHYDKELQTIVVTPAITERVLGKKTI